MDTLFLFIIAILLGLVLADFEKFIGQRNPLLPLRYLPRKQSFGWNADKDMYALYYTDMLYPVYGRETILTVQRGYRDCTYKASELSFEDRDKEKEILYVTQTVNSMLLERNLGIMMQANLDVLNGKMTIQEARHKTLDSVDINNAAIPPLAARQIAVDVHEGVHREVWEYLDHKFLDTEARKRYEERKHEKTNDEKTKS